MQTWSTNVYKPILLHHHPLSTLITVWVMQKAVNVHQQPIPVMNKISCIVCEETNPLSSGLLATGRKDYLMGLHTQLKMDHSPHFFLLTIPCQEACSFKHQKMVPGVTLLMPNSSSEHYNATTRCTKCTNSSVQMEQGVGSPSQCVVSPIWKMQSRNNW